MENEPVTLDDQLYEAAPWHESVIGWLQDPGAVFAKLFADPVELLISDPAGDRDYARGIAVDLMSEDYDRVYVNLGESHEEVYEAVCADLQSFIGAWRARARDMLLQGLLGHNKELGN